MIPKHYFVAIRRTPTGYSADVPDLPGCVATGMTVEDSRQQIAEAIERHLELMEQAGETVPAPNSAVQFSVDDEAAEELCTGSK